MRIGHGYDVHRLVNKRKLILGGVEIPYNKGLQGHSDADVLAHAVMDALLGALALGDIGKHFPDTDSQYEGADSMLLLKRVAGLISKKGYSLENLDTTIIAQAPRLSAHIETIRANIAEACQAELCRISIKATTEERLGFTGEGLGIAVHCVCLLSENSSK